MPSTLAARTLELWNRAAGWPVVCRNRSSGRRFCSSMRGQDRRPGRRQRQSNNPATATLTPRTATISGENRSAALLRVRKVNEALRLGRAFASLPLATDRTIRFRGGAGCPRARKSGRQARESDLFLGRVPARAEIGNLTVVQVGKWRKSDNSVGAREKDCIDSFAMVRIRFAYGFCKRRRECRGARAQGSFSCSSPSGREWPRVAAAFSLLLSRAEGR